MEKQEKNQKIEKLNQQIGQCRRCGLFKTKTKYVPGEGHVDAQIMLIGEAPGKSEDLAGRPFVGRAGDVLNELLDSVNLKREQVFICNILKCRPPGNRNPESEEIRACVGSLDIQIKIINPKVIGTLGSFASTYIFQKFGLPVAKISDIHGRVFDVKTELGDKKIIPLFHPAVATYNVNKFRVLSDDFRIMQHLPQEIKESAGSNVL